MKAMLKVWLTACNARCMARKQVVEPQHSTFDNYMWAIKEFLRRETALEFNEYAVAAVLIVAATVAAFILVGNAIADTFTELSIRING